MREPPPLAPFAAPPGTRLFHAGRGLALRMTTHSPPPAHTSRAPCTPLFDRLASRPGEPVPHGLSALMMYGNEPGPRCYQVVPPAGTRIGQILHVALDHGQLLTISVPDGWVEGQALVLRPNNREPNPRGHMPMAQMAEQAPQPMSRPYLASGSQSMQILSPGSHPAPNPFAYAPPPPLPLPPPQPPLQPPLQPPHYPAPAPAPCLDSFVMHPHCSVPPPTMMPLGHHAAPPSPHHAPQHVQLRHAPFARVPMVEAAGVTRAVPPPICPFPSRLTNSIHPPTPAATHATPRVCAGPAIASSHSAAPMYSAPAYTASSSACTNGGSSKRHATLDHTSVTTAGSGAYNTPKLGGIALGGAFGKLSGSSLGGGSLEDLFLGVEDDMPSVGASKPPANRPPPSLTSLKKKARLKQAVATSRRTIEPSSSPADETPKSSPGKLARAVSRTPAATARRAHQAGLRLVRRRLTAEKAQPPPFVVLALGVASSGGEDGVSVRVALSLSAVARAGAGGTPRREFDCGECRTCLDKVKFGGQGKLRKACQWKGMDRGRAARANGDEALPDGELVTANLAMASRLRSRALPVRGCHKATLESLKPDAPFADAMDPNARGIEVGPSYQATIPPLTSRAVLPPPAQPPLCKCAQPRPCVWERGRWWCAHSSSGGCAYELVPPPAGVARAPLCHCSLPASYRYSCWWCPCEPRGCGFKAALTAEPAEPELITDHANEYRTAARSTAALLTAAAFGPMNSFAFVAPASGAAAGHGLGLHARVPLRPAQAICSLPEGVGSTPPVGEEQPSMIGRYVNHSVAPNARLELWHASPLLATTSGLDTRKPYLLIVATELIEAGQEIRIDFGADGLGVPPIAAAANLLPEDVWRRGRTGCPPATEASAVFSLLSSEGLLHLGVDIESEDVAESGANSSKSSTTTDQPSEAAGAVAASRRKRKPARRRNAVDGRDEPGKRARMRFSGRGCARAGVEEEEDDETTPQDDEEEDDD